MKINFLCKMVMVLLMGFQHHVVMAQAIIPAPPKVNASSYMVMDFDSGVQLIAENIDEKLPPASLTKMMTVYVAAKELESGKITLEDEFTVSEKAWRTPGSRTFIEVGKRVSVDALLHGVIVQSGNDASVALAEYISGTEEVFADLMNEYARRLGMTHTHFVNSTGLPDPEHYTTAGDLAILAQALIREHPDIYAMHKIKEFTYNDIKQYNRNRLLWSDSSIDGIKTGHTEEAGYCLVASAVRDGMRLISVVMGSEGTSARAKATQAILNYGFRFYDTRKLYSPGEVVTSVKIWKAESDTINLGIDQEVYLTLPRGQYEKLESVIEIDNQIIAPVEEGEQQGMLNVMLADEAVATLPLLALESVPQGGFIRRLKDGIRLLLQ